MYKVDIFHSHKFNMEIKHVNVKIIEFIIFIIILYLYYILQNENNLIINFNLNYFIKVTILNIKIIMIISFIIILWVYCFIYDQKNFFITDFYSSHYPSIIFIKHLNLKIIMLILFIILLFQYVILQLWYCLFHYIIQFNLKMIQ